MLMRERMGIIDIFNINIFFPVRLDMNDMGVTLIIIQFETIIPSYERVAEKFQNTVGNVGDINVDSPHSLCGY